MEEFYELLRDWETPFTKFHTGHRNDVRTWSRIMGISTIEFYEHLEKGTFKDWLKRDIEKYWRRL